MKQLPDMWWFFVIFFVNEVNIGVSLSISIVSSTTIIIVHLIEKQHMHYIIHGVLLYLLALMSFRGRLFG
jgi:hypothetical protein